jgi:hypothetical protein
LRDQRSRPARVPRRERTMKPIASTVFARLSKGLSFALGDRLRIQARAVCTPPLPCAEGGTAILEPW